MRHIILHDGIRLLIVSVALAYVFIPIVWSNARQAGQMAVVQ